MIHRLKKYIEEKNQSIVNDYIQVFKTLLNGKIDENAKTFEEIYNLMVQSLGKIEPKDSKPLKRFYDNENDKKLKGDRTAKFYSNLLDSIFVYFMHSYDLGYKVKGKKYTKDNDDDEKNVNDTDNEITKLKQYLKTQQTKLKDVIPNYLNENKDNDDLKQNYDRYVIIFFDYIFPGNRIEINHENNKYKL